MRPRRKEPVMHTLMFKAGNRLAQYKVPEANRWAMSIMKATRTKGEGGFVMKGMETTVLYALKGLRSAYPEIPAEKIKQVNRGIIEIFRNTSTEGKALREIKIEIFEKFDEALARAGLTKEQIGFYSKLILQLTEYKERHVFE